MNISTTKNGHNGFRKNGKKHFFLAVSLHDGLITYWAQNFNFTPNAELFQIQNG
jgi:hypothetical protein